MNCNDLFLSLYLNLFDIQSELASKCVQNRMELAADKTKLQEDFQNDIPEEEKEETVKPISKKKKKKTQGL